MRRTLFALLFVLLLVGCEPPYLRSDGSIAFDVQIRIAAPVATATLPSNPTLLPTFTPSLATTNTPVISTAAPDPTPSRESTQFVPDTPQPLTYITNTTNSVWNIRDEPSATSADLGDLKVGESIEYLFQVNTGAGWFGVQWEGGTAYISSACCVDRG